MYQLIETIRVEHGEVHYADYHQRRMVHSVGSESVELLPYIASIELPPSGCYKLRICYTREGITGHTLAPYVTRRVESFLLVEDDEIDYSLKWEDRSGIDRLMSGRGGCDDILIVRHGRVTDSSIANIALLEGKQWVTPHAPLLEGTCRARLLDEGVLTVREVSVESIHRYSHLLPINAMMGFDPRRAVRITERTVQRERVTTHAKHSLAIGGK